MHRIDEIVPDRLYLPAQVAELVQVAPNTVRNWAKAGLINSVQIGKRRRYLGRDVLAFLGDKLAASAPAPEPETKRDRKARVERAAERLRQQGFKVPGAKS